jgi:hypothetical protein
MLTGLLASIVAVSLFGGWLFFQQPAMIFFPTSELVETPASWGLQYEETMLQTSDGVKLHGWFIPHQGTSRTLLFFHGNAGNISHRRDSVMIFHRLGLNILIFDYRGYGQSQGRLSEAGLYLDARAAWNYLRQEKGLGREQIILFGRSLGGVVAAELAAEVKPAGLILESTFSSAKDMARAVFPIWSRVVPLRFEFNTVESIGRLQAPLLVIHSTEDEITPFQLGEKVYRAAAQPKTLLRIHGDHNAGFILSQPAYEEALGEFLSRNVAEPTG